MFYNKIIFDNNKAVVEEKLKSGSKPRQPQLAARFLVKTVLLGFKQLCKGGCRDQSLPREKQG